MHDPVKARGEQFFKGGAVGELASDEGDARGDHAASGVAEIVVDNSSMALSFQYTGDYPTNVPSSPSDQNSQNSPPPILYAKCVPAASESLTVQREKSLVSGNLRGPGSGQGSSLFR